MSKRPYINPFSRGYVLYKRGEDRVRFSLLGDEISREHYFLLQNYGKKHIPLRDKKYTVKEFFSLIENRAYACPNKERVLALLMPML